MPRLHDAAAWRHHGMGGLIADSHCGRRSHDSSRILRADSEWNRIHMYSTVMWQPHWQ